MRRYSQIQSKQMSFRNRSIHAHIFCDIEKIEAGNILIYSVIFRNILRGIKYYTLYLHPKIIKYTFDIF